MKRKALKIQPDPRLDAPALRTSYFVLGTPYSVLFPLTPDPRPAARKHRLAASRVARRGFSLLEFVVAMVVFSVALTGLLPLLTILSRDLQPLRKQGAPGGYGCFTPARDGNTTGSNLIYQQHSWYLAPYTDPWVRKLGASAAAATTPPSGVSPTPIQSPVVFQYAYGPGGPTAQDGPGTFVAVGSWVYQPNGAGITNYYYDQAPVAPATTTDNATWTLNVTTAGWYSIQASWPADFCTTNPGYTLETVQYAVTNNGTPVTNNAGVSSPFSVDQTQGPSTGISDGVNVWWNVTGPIKLQKGTVVVTLGVPSSATNTGCVLADAVRIVRNDLQVLSIQRALNQMNGNSDGSDVNVNLSATVNLCK